jgi:hypothetical protein
MLDAYVRVREESNVPDSIARGKASIRRTSRDRGRAVRLAAAIPITGRGAAIILRKQRR